MRSGIFWLCPDATNSQLVQRTDKIRGHTGAAVHSPEVLHKTRNNFLQVSLGLPIMFSNGNSEFLTQIDGLRKADHDYPWIEFGNNLCWIKITTHASIVVKKPFFYLSAYYLMASRSPFVKIGLA